MEKIELHPQAMKLSQRCKMGDTSAMMELALYYKGLCEPELRGLMEEYERRPDQEIQKRLRSRMVQSDSRNVLPAEAYIMWMLRAARFGDERAEEQTGRLPYYVSYGTAVRSGYHQEFPKYLPFCSLLGCFCRNSEYPAWGACIRNAGFPDIPDVEPGGESTIIFWPSPGVYIFTYKSGCIAADEYGFGAESDYTSIWLDEFFCPVAVQDKKQLPAQLKELDRVREQYWASPLRSAKERRYRRRLRISAQIPWGKAWAEATPLLGIEIKNT